jgi:cyclase
MKDRRNFIQLASAGTFGYLFLNSCTKKMDFSGLNKGTNLAYNMKHLRGNVGIFTEKGGTIMWYNDGKDSAVVDTQFPEQATHLREELKKLSGENLTALFNTHHHGDHSSGNIVFKEFTTKIIAHENSLKNQKISAEKMNAVEKSLFPNITFKDMYKTKVGKENIQCHYFGAGHTNGDAIIHFEDTNVMHIGDLMFNRRFPYIDKQGGASIKNWALVHDDIIKLADKDTIIVGGHANAGYEVIVTKEDIKAFQNYLQKLLIFGEQSVKAGKTKEEVLKELKVIPGAEEWTGDGISRSIDAVYIELTSK